MNPAQIATVAAGAGFSGAGLTRAVAVALAESGGNPNAVHVNADRYRSRDRGLWQINNHWHPEVSDAAAFNPTTAAAAAYRISGGGKDWSAWSTWKNGAAQAQMGRAQLAAASVAPGATATPAGLHIPVPGPLLGLGGLLGGGLPGGLSAVNPLSGIVHLLTTFTAIEIKSAAWVADPHNWARVAMVTGGTLAVLLSLEMIAKSGAAGSTAARVAAMPGKAAKNAASTAVSAAKVAAVA